MKVNCSKEMQPIVHLYKNMEQIPENLQQRSRRSATGEDPCNKLHLEMTSEVRDGHTYYNTSVSGIFFKIFN